MSCSPLVSHSVNGPLVRCDDLGRCGIKYLRNTLLCGKILRYMYFEAEKKERNVRETPKCINVHELNTLISPCSLPGLLSFLLWL